MSEPPAISSNKRSFERVPITPANMPTLADYDAALVEIERLREALEDAADMLHECALECSECDYGHGATGKGSEGGVCEECAPTREAERRARESISGDSSAPETAEKPVAWRHLVDSPYEKHPRWHYTEDRPAEEPERFEALYARPSQVETSVRGKTSCKHDWVGDDNCAYCAVEDLTAANNDMDAVIGDLREILADFDSEDIRVMAQRAVDRIAELTVGKS